MEQTQEIVEFKAYPKMGRFSREVIVTEKCDGTNAQVCITRDGQFMVGSRTRWITPENDNYGFAKWAMEHKDELMTLGAGRHFGEWMGAGIQRNYGIREKRWLMFNVTQFCLHTEEPQPIPTGDPVNVKMQSRLPACVGLVPILWRGNMDDLNVPFIMDDLKTNGSRIVPHYQNPEGIVIWHTASNTGWKKTIDGDDMPKSLRNG